MFKSQIVRLALNRRKWSRMGREWSPGPENRPPGMPRPLSRLWDHSRGPKSKKKAKSGFLVSPPGGIGQARRAIAIYLIYPIEFSSRSLRGGAAIVFVGLRWDVFCLQARWPDLDVRTAVLLLAHVGHSEMRAISVQMHKTPDLAFLAILFPFFGPGRPLGVG